MRSVRTVGSLRATGMRSVRTVGSLRATACVDDMTARWWNSWSVTRTPTTGVGYGEWSSAGRGAWASQNQAYIQSTYWVNSAIGAKLPSPRPALPVRPTAAPSPSSCAQVVADANSMGFRIVKSTRPGTNVNLKTRLGNVNA
eukprot:365364-Chlamydomonas_euryale.AAC.4